MPPSIYQSNLKRMTTTLQARAEVVEYSRRELGRLLEAPSELRKAALTQMLRAKSKRMFLHSSSQSAAPHPQPPPHNGEDTAKEQRYVIESRS